MALCISGGEWDQTIESLVDLASDVSVNSRLVSDFPGCLWGDSPTCESGTKSANNEG